MINPTPSPKGHTLIEYRALNESRLGCGAARRQGGAYFVSQQRYRRYRHLAFFVITLTVLAAVRGSPPLHSLDAPLTHSVRVLPSGSSHVATVLQG